MLDRSRSYGTVHGSSEITGACFTQDGKFFNVSGEQVWPEPQAEAEPDAPKKRSRTKKVKVEDDSQEAEASADSQDVTVEDDHADLS